MTSILRPLLAAALLASSSLCLAASSTPPPSSAMPASLDTTDWLIVNDAAGFSNGLIYYCEPGKSSAFSPTCPEKDKASLTPAQALAKLAPKGAQLTGFSPLVSGYGRFTGVVLYYKRAPAP